MNIRTKIAITKLKYHLHAGMFWYRVNKIGLVPDVPAAKKVLLHELFAAKYVDELNLPGKEEVFNRINQLIERLEKEVGR